MGYIYILTNPSFPEWIKIGYTDDVVEGRVKDLNKSECIPFSFRIFATYEVASKLADKDVHELIDMYAPNLRSVEKNGEKIVRKREFYNMTPEYAYKTLLIISKINGMNPPVLYQQTKAGMKDEKIAEKARKNRHHFDTITFTSSLTGLEYQTKMGENGVLMIVETKTGKEVPNHAEPSKKQIVRQALIDLGEEADNNQTLYQLAHSLIKVLR